MTRQKLEPVERVAPLTAETYASGAYVAAKESGKPFRVVAVAVANKMARVAWALLARGGSYRAPALAAAA